MKSEFIGAGPYLAAFSRLLECIEITTRRGEPLPLDEGIGSITEAIVSLKNRSGKAFLIGNGGSAAIVSHVHNDLCKSVGIRAIVFNETPLLTALANDDGYAAVIRRACLRAGVEPWHPNQLRHLFGSSVRRCFGLEAAQVLLRQAKADVTQVHAQTPSQTMARVERRGRGWLILTAGCSPLIFVIELQSQLPFAQGGGEVFPRLLT